ncbi:hypothetical protein D9758_006196 [Tetrapyrgos nigripes]|uniref:Uncharacterized protein n=1 Tax=Tetrapyrgos nigripes TaxID=182062 RepID=A0A8H5GAJ5_9AGAR|nr:hypothetical protein D9758_006196 [Tetrapyrgos nigripes]
MPDSPVPQEQLSSYFARSASSVHGYADRFEQDYARPAIDTSNAFFIEHPIFSVFLFSFVVLSLLPIGLFIVFCACAILTFTILAICFIISSSVIVGLFALFFLTCSLLLILCFSLFLTAALFLAYISYRLFISVRTKGMKGVYGWGSETISYLWPLRIPALPSRSNVRPTNKPMSRRAQPISSGSDDITSGRRGESSHGHDSSLSSDGAILVDENDTESSDHFRSAESDVTSEVKKEED